MSNPHAYGTWYYCPVCDNHGQPCHDGMCSGYGGLMTAVQPVPEPRHIPTSADEKTQRTRMTPKNETANTAGFNVGADRSPDSRTADENWLLRSLQEASDAALKLPQWARELEAAIDDAYPINVKQQQAKQPSAERDRLAERVDVYRIYRGGVYDLMRELYARVRALEADKARAIQQAAHQAAIRTHRACEVAEFQEGRSDWSVSVDAIARQVIAEIINTESHNE